MNSTDDSLPRKRSAIDRRNRRDPRVPDSETPRVTRARDRRPGTYIVHHHAANARIRKRNGISRSYTILLMHADLLDAWLSCGVMSIPYLNGFSKRSCDVSPFHTPDPRPETRVAGPARKFRYDKPREMSRCGFVLLVVRKSFSKKATSDSARVSVAGPRPPGPGFAKSLSRTIETATRRGAVRPAVRGQVGRA